MFRAVARRRHAAGRSCSASIAAVNSVIAFFYYARRRARDVVPRPAPEGVDRTPMPIPAALDRRDRHHAPPSCVVVGVYPQLFARIGELAAAAEPPDRRRRAAASARSPSASTAKGPIPFDAFVEAALYGPDGFFAPGGGAGRAGRDFVTSPEVGRCSARASRARSTAGGATLGEPDPFLVVEAGAGRGRLARDVLRAEPGCAPALRYVLVERVARRCGTRSASCSRSSRPTRRSARSRADDDDDVADARSAARPDRHARSTSCPRVALDGVVLANELLDNLPFGIVERADGGWSRCASVTPTATLRRGARARGRRARRRGRRRRSTTRAGRRAAARCRVRSTTWLRRVRDAVRRGASCSRRLRRDRAPSSCARPAAGCARTAATTAARRRSPRPATQDITADVPRRVPGARGRRVPGSRSSATMHAGRVAARARRSTTLVAEGAAHWDAARPRRRPRGARAAAAASPRPRRSPIPAASRAHRRRPTKKM